MRIPPLLWLIAAIFVVSCFFSGAWLGRTLSALPPIVAPAHASSEQTDQARLRTEQRETATATAVASPVAILIVFLTALVLSGLPTKGAAKTTRRTNSNPGPGSTG